MAHETNQAKEVQGSPLSILLVDDDVELCELLEEFFDQRGFRIGKGKGVMTDMGCALAGKLAHGR